MFESLYYRSNYFASNYYRATITLGDTISVHVVSAGKSLPNPRLTVPYIVSTQTVDSTADVLPPYLPMGDIIANAINITASLGAPRIVANALISLTAISAAASLGNPAMGTKELSVESINAIASLSAIAMIAGVDVILPASVSAEAKVSRPAVADIYDLEKFFHANEGMIRFFKMATGSKGVQFNDLAREYYKYVSTTNAEIFNELNKAAQDAEGFVGQSPTDWRNL